MSEKLLAILPSAEEMRKRLLEMDKKNAYMQKFYSILMRYAEMEISPVDFAEIYYNAISEYCIPVLHKDPFLFMTLLDQYPLVVDALFKEDKAFANAVKEALPPFIASPERDL